MWTAVLAGLLCSSLLGERAAVWQNEQSAVYHSVKQQVAIAAPLSHKEVILGVKRNVEARQPASARYAGPAAAPKHAVGSQVAATLHDGSVQLVTVHKIHDLAGHDHLSYTVAVPQDNPDRKPVFVRVHSTDIQPRALRIVSPTDASVVVANRHDVTANISLHFTALHFQLGEQADGEACFDMRWSALRYYKGTPLVYGYTPRMNGTSFPRGESIDDETIAADHLPVGYIYIVSSLVDANHDPIHGAQNGEVRFTIVPEIDALFRPSYEWQAVHHWHLIPPGLEHRADDSGASARIPLTWMLDHDIEEASSARPVMRLRCDVHQFMSVAELEAKARAVVWREAWEREPSAVATLGVRECGRSSAPNVSIIFGEDFSHAGHYTMEEVEWFERMSFGMTTAHHDAYAAYRIVLDGCVRDRRVERLRARLVPDMQAMGDLLLRFGLLAAPREAAAAEEVARADRALVSLAESQELQEEASSNLLNLERALVSIIEADVERKMRKLLAGCD